MKENRHKQAKAGGIISLLFSCLCLCSCVQTSFREYADNGNIRFEFKSNADFGVTTSGNMDDNLDTGLLPSLGGKQKNAYVVTQAESTNKPSIEVGDNFKIEGPVVHSTGMVVVGRTVTRSMGIVGKTIGWIVGVNAWKDISLGKSHNKVLENESNNGVEINDSNNSLEALKDNNQRDIALEALKE